MRKGTKPYVYGLIDPRTGALFYVGKATTSDRMKQHVSEARRGKDGIKNDRIREILGAGLLVEFSVLEEFENDLEAYAAEKLLIAEHGNALTNRNKGGGGGYGLGAYGYMRARAQRALSRFPDFEQWASIWSGEAIHALSKPCGSLEGFYLRLRAEIIKEAESPAPNVVTVEPDGKIVFGWSF